VNGQKSRLAPRRFGAFCFEVTDLVHVGSQNLVAVRVDNARFDDIPPLSGDFTIYGGLYRGATLLALDPLHISPLDDASRGVYLRPTKLDDASATVEVTTKLRNDSSVPTDATVECRVLDDGGKTLLTRSRRADHRQWRRTPTPSSLSPLRTRTGGTACTTRICTA
jgi:beta-galactosidase